jgi:Fis family transcriptional regulator, factor for inversion stimulation protein
MKPDKPFSGPETDKPKGKPKSVLNTKIGDSIDTLVEYLVDNDIRGIHPLIMGEVEKRLIIKVLERSRGNKLQAAKLLGMSRNTFHRKIQKMLDLRCLADKE